MYYPKNQIQKGFYSNNDLAIATTQTLYVGPYFKTSDGNSYTGKEPNDGKNQLLILPSELDTTTSNVGPSGTDIEDPRFNDINLAYSILSGASKNNPPFIPIPYYPILSPENIDNGEFVRYFAKKSNQNLYTEINGNNFAESVSSNLYISFQLPWVISGDKENVRQINAKQIGFVEKNLQIIGLGAYLRFNYLQFYQE
jgi:hypothetical protein